MKKHKTLRIEEEIDKDIENLAKELNSDYSKALNFALAAFFATSKGKGEKYLKTILKDVVKAL